MCNSSVDPSPALGLLIQTSAGKAGGLGIPRPDRVGNPGLYLRVLNWLSEYGLSLETWGRLWLLVTPRSESSSATVLEIIADPRSAWIVRSPFSIHADRGSSMIS